MDFYPARLDEDSWDYEHSSLTDTHKTMSVNKAMTCTSHTHVNTSLLIVILTPGPLWRPAGVPVSLSSRSSLRMWAGVWHWESAVHSCSHSTKTSMWHLTAMPDERRTPPQAIAALPFKMRPRGPCPERRHLWGLRHRGSLRLFFPPTCGLLSVLGC